MKIGILDYQLTNYHLKKFHGLLTGAVGEGKVNLTAASELVATEEGLAWCTEVGLPYAQTSEEVISSSDALLVLAPNNPEKHLEVARRALESGKPIFVDKMLASTPAEAWEMIRLAREHQTPLMSCSALRFALELDELDRQISGPVEGIFARGLGKFPIYGVHTITMAVRYFGPKVKRIIDTGKPGAHVITVDSGRDRCTIEIRESENQYEATPWQLGVLTRGRYEIATVKNFDGFYENLMRKVVEFFRTGNSPVSVDEQFAVVQVQTAAAESLEDGGKWVVV